MLPEFGCTGSAISSCDPVATLAVLAAIHRTVLLSCAGSAISSIDPVATLAVLNEVEVPPLLYNLVFGESVLNDAGMMFLFALFQASIQSVTACCTLVAAHVASAWAMELCC